MAKNEHETNGTDPVDQGRRRLIRVAGGSALATLIGGTVADRGGAAETPALRWGVVGTGGIANQVAPMIELADSAELAAVSSRRMSTAREFAAEHGIDRTFDSWEEMAAWDGVDALYVATPTSVREEICIAAATNGKHVLGEKPFASLESLQRITAACRDNKVGFMDGTHFVHHPRTGHIRSAMQQQVGWPWSVDSAFQFNLTDRDNIRYNRDLEPLGAIGDAGWYNMRAAVEFVAPDVELADAAAYCRRDKQTGAVISASGVMHFDDGATSTWNCGFDSGAVVMDLRICGANGLIDLDDFVGNRTDDAVYTVRRGGFGSGRVDPVSVPSAKPAAALMVEDFAAMVTDAAHLERSRRASERTQRWLDAAWNAAIRNERA